MNWVHDFQLFLFDFDGLLVNTERLHFAAYQRMCKNRGFELDWTFHRYSRAAHHQATDLRDQIYLEFPSLKSLEPNWNTLYEEKKQAFLQLLDEGMVELMPGVAELLNTLKASDIKCCVVTHSPSALINKIRSQNPTLDSIPHWITREDYAQPKPNPECYLKAINQLATSTDRIIGFEDSPRGLQALMKTRAYPVLICDPALPYVNELLSNGIKHFDSLPSIHNITQDNRN